jgi:putative membrane protein
MQRQFKDYFIISLKGIAMGAADAVPGVSGGTIAFISGIYEELISTISNININLFKTLKTEGISEFWKQLNGNFLLALLAGIIVSFVTFMRLAKYLIENNPILIWSFFFGLIIASIIYVAKQIKLWRPITFIMLIVGAFLAFYITTLPSLGSNTNSYFLFIAGAIAICAMILPGISGSFILVILGAYKTLSDAFHDFDLKKIALFASGALVGLLSFSHILKWLFKNYENTTLALLTGFIFGSLNKIWPWKETVSVLNENTGNTLAFSEVSNLGTLAIYQKNMEDFETYKTVLEQSILPSTYSQINGQVSSELVLAIALMIAGFLTIFILEKLGSRTS